MCSHVDNIFNIHIYIIQVLRVESPDGTKRIQVSQTESSYDLFEKVT